MAYLEIWKKGELIKRQHIDDIKAEKGCRVRLGGTDSVVVKLGESKPAGEYILKVISDSSQKQSLRTVQDRPNLEVSQSEDGGNVCSNKDSLSGDAFPVIQGYTISGELGAGGMGAVYKATQLSTSRQVALKLLGGQTFDSVKAQARFDREVQLTAQLEHPNIARIYDSGLQKGIYYYAMEYIDGVALDEYVNNKKLSHRQILELLSDICKAVQHAHQRGIIHRDLKPSNILVTEDGQPHIVDFGLAKAFLSENSELTVSIEGEIAGTPAYMSPEQAAGRTRDLDTRTDVYSLGIILFRFFTGHAPHDLSGSRLDVYRRIAENDVQRPCSLNKSINSEVEAIILKALAHSPDDRYLSAGDMADDIDNYLNGEPVAAKPATTFYFLHKKVRKHSVSVGVALLIVFIIAGIGLYAYTKVIESRIRIKAVQEDLDIQRKAAELARDEAVSVQAKWAELELMILKGRNESDIRTAIRALRNDYEMSQQEIEKLKQEIASLKKTIALRQWQPVHKTPPPAITVDNKPFFVISSQVCGSADYPKVKQGGYDLIEGNIRGYDFRTLALSGYNGMAMTDIFAQNDLGELWYTCGVRTYGSISWPYINAKPKSIDIEKIRELLNPDSTRDLNRIHAWALPESSIASGIPVDNLRQVYDFLKERFPQKTIYLPVAQNDFSNSRFADYVPYCDTILIKLPVFDPKIYSELEPGIRDPILVMNYWIENVKKIAPGKPIWVSLQVEQNGDVAASPEQYRTMAYLAISQGATGLFVSGERHLLKQWPNTGNQSESPSKLDLLQQEANRIAGELKQLSPAILEGEAIDQVFISDNDELVDCKTYVSPFGNRLYIIAVNTSDQSLNITAHVPENMKDLISALNEERQIIAQNGMFQDHFLPYQTHVYELIVDYSEQIIYVSQAATGENDGTSWQNAYTDLQDALENATRGSQIWVASGTYKPDKGTKDRKSTFNLKNNTKLYGGFKGVESRLEERNVVANKTILSGDLNADDNKVSSARDILKESQRRENSYHVVTAKNLDKSVVFSGFTISDGNADTGDWKTVIDTTLGGGMIIDNGSIIIEECIFENNSALGFGGGVLNGAGSDSEFRHCLFRLNMCNNFGGGMCCWGDSKPLVMDCTFERNYIDGATGGGLYLVSCAPDIIRCTFVGNAAGFVSSHADMPKEQGPSGGGCRTNSFYGKFENCNFRDNYASFTGGGIHVGGGYGEMIECIFGNNVAENHGGGLQITGLAPRFRNCIITNNLAKGWGGGGVNTYSTRPIFENCTIENNFAEDGWGGGVRVEYKTHTTFRNCSIIGNTAHTVGGGINNTEGTASLLMNCMIRNNTAQEVGGGIHAWRADVNLIECTISGNRAGNDGGGIFDNQSEVRINKSACQENIPNDTRHIARP